VGLVEDVARRHGVLDVVQATIATSNGDSVWAFRYSTRHESRSLYHSTEMTRLQELHPEVEALHGLAPNTRLVVSEPIRDLPGAWREVPESTCGVIQAGEDELRPFEPEPPVHAVSGPVG
jgi:predicted glutamine amidotransferase